MLDDVPRPSGNHLMERWLDQLALGYAIETLAAVGPPEGKDFDRFDDAVYELVRKNPLGLRELPVVVLAQLAQISDPNYEYEATAAETMLGRLHRDRKKGGPPAILAAKLVANRMRAGTHTAGQMTRLVEKLGLGKLPETSEAQGALRRLLDAAARRDPEAFHKILEAFGELSVAVSLQGNWRQVENAFLHSLFAWPLLVYRDAHLGTSLPVRAEMAVPNAGSRSRGGVWLTSYGERYYDPSLFQSARKARHVAIGLWQNVNRRWDATIRNRVGRADALIDMTYAQEVRRRAGYIINPAPVTWGSSETYLGLMLHARLVAPSALEGACATGELGSSYNRADPSDRPVLRVDGVEAKLRRAAAAAVFDRVVYPTANADVNAATLGLPRHLALQQGDYFSEYARATMPQASDRHDFVRCPDLELAWRDSGTTDGPEVTRALAIIRSKQQIVDVPEDLPARAIIRALRIQNGDVETYASAHGELHPGTPLGPSDFVQSIAVIRATPYETNERFWRVIWDMLDGDELAWSYFSRAVSCSTPATYLANLLCRTTCSPGRLRRVPDRLVIVGARYLSNDQALCPTSPFKRLQIDALRPHLERELVGRYRPPYLAEAIGPARMILVPNDWLPERDHLRPEEVSADLWEPFRLLSTLDHGFSRDAAKLMLDKDEFDVRIVLRRLEHTNVRGRPLLSSVGKNGNDRYFLNFKADKNGQTAKDKARLHLTAAETLVGFRKSKRALFSDYSRAFTPAVVHDAQQHLRQAEIQAKSWTPNAQDDTARRNQFLQMVKDARIRLTLLTEPFSWTAVRWAATQKGEVDASLSQTALEYVEEARQQRQERRWAHPIEISHLMRLIDVQLKRIQNDLRKKEQEEAAILRSFLSGLYQSALEECVKYDHVAFEGRLAEGDSCRFAVRSTHVTLELRRDPSRMRARALFDDITAADRVMHAAREVPEFSYFVFRGDCEENDAEAVQHYRRGFFDEFRIAGVKERRRREALMKWIGATLLSGGEPGRDVANVKRELGEEFEDRAELDKQPEIGLDDKSARDRWIIGRNFFLTGARPPRRLLNR